MADRQSTAPSFHVEPLEPRLLLSTVLLSEDFNTSPINGIPNSIQPHPADFILGEVGSNPDSTLQIAGSGGAYADPFGGAGNRSMVIDNFAGGSNTPSVEFPVVTWLDEFGDVPNAHRSGTIDFDLYLTAHNPATEFWTFVDFRVGFGGAGRTNPSTVNDTIIWNVFRIETGAQSPNFYFDNATAPSNGQGKFAPDTPFHVHYDIFSDETYTVSIDGTPLELGGSATIPWRTGGAGAGFNSVDFQTAFGIPAGEYYVDNLVVEVGDPEPGGWTPPADEPTNVGEWHQHRGNKRLTGESQLVGDIGQAHIAWSQFIGSRESWVGLSPDPSGQNTVNLPGSDLPMGPAEQIAWNINGPYFDLPGIGATIPQTTGPLLRIGDFIPGNGVLEKLEGEVFDPTFGQGVIRLSTYSSGAWIQQWESPVIPSMFAIPNIITGDFDNDSQLEVAITPWTDLYLLDMATGQIEQTETFKPPANQSGRPYGWLGAYDVTGDDKEEFFVIGDFQDFISVIGWNGNDMVKLWEHVIDPNLSGKQTAHRPGAFPVQDVTGDGQLDLVTSIFNENGDERWHLVVFDSQTGAIIHDLIDHVVDGARDVNGDGDAELFVRETQGSLLPPSTTVKILDWNGNGFDTLWSQANAGFISQPIPDFPLFVNSATSTRKLDLLTGPIDPGGQDVFFTRTIIDPATNESRVDVWQVSDLLLGDANKDGQVTGADLISVQQNFGNVGPTPLQGDANNDGQVTGADLISVQQNFGNVLGPAVGFVLLGSATGTDLDVIAVRETADATPSILLGSDVVGADPGSVDLDNFDGAPAFSQGGSPPRASAVVGRLDGPASAPTVIVQGGSETIVAFQPQDDGSIVPVWAKPGVGGHTGASQFTGQHEYSGIALGDVIGDGNLETIYATIGEAGQARLVAAASDGSEIWHTDFDVPGGTRIFNQPGLTLWRTGNFTSTDHEDVLVQIMRGSGGTGEFHLLDGLTGDLIWMRSFGNTPGSNPVERNAGEAHMAVYDWDGDGLDEAVNFHPDMFYVVDGNGTNLIDKAVLGGGVFPDGSPLYGTPIVADFLNNGTDTILFAGSYAQFGLVDKNAVPIWNTPFTFDNTPGLIQSIGDVDNDGDLDVLSPGHPISPGVDTTSRFHAYDGPTGQLLWTVDLPGRAYAPVGGAYFDSPTLSVSADVDGDGRVESVFAITGTVYVVGADPGGTSGQIEWSFTPDGGVLGSPIIADGDGDGVAEIIVVSTSGFIYGIELGDNGASPAAPAGGGSGSFAPAIESVSPATTAEQMSVTREPTVNITADTTEAGAEVIGFPVKQSDTQDDRPSKTPRLDQQYQRQRHRPVSKIDHAVSQPRQRLLAGLHNLAPVDVLSLLDPQHDNA